MAQTRLLRDSVYEEIGATYQCIQIDTLNKALARHGVSDTARRRKICEEFIFSMGNFHDECWFEAGGLTVYPLLCFSKAFLNTDVDVDDLGEVLAPSQLFAFHEYAFGNNSWYFEEHSEDASEIKLGPLGSERT